MPNLRRPVNNARSRNYLNACNCVVDYDTISARPTLYEYNQRHCLTRLARYDTRSAIIVSITVDSVKFVSNDRPRL